MNIRYPFLDVYRGFIVLFMIEGHVVREVLLPAIRSTELFRLHELFHGITGPGFLFGAGITFGISAQRKWGDFLSFSPTLRRRLRKILLLLGIGYLLHLPFFSLSKMLAETPPQEWSLFWSFDVLQCIAISLLILQLLLLGLKKERMFLLSTIAIMVVMVYSAPFVWLPHATEGIPQFLAAGLHGNSGSTYPIVPYSAFLFAGALVSYEFMKFAEIKKEKVFVKRLAIAGVGLHVVGLGLDALPFQMYPPHDFWSVSPNFFLINLGGLFLLLSGAWYVEQKIFTEQLSQKMPWMILFGVESLFVYVLHLLVLYGWIMNPESKIAGWWGGSMNWAGALGLSLAVIVVMYLVARPWNYFKKNHPVLMKGIYWWMGSAFLFEFLTRSY